ncbi:MAG TPA: amidohydrolase family protein [Candidatus Binataceae bacterium]|nr:amidohydrolase family protein [Candidatus Binataceae bacterium]
MMCDLVLKDGKVVTPTGVVNGGVAIADGTIVAIGPDAGLPTGRRELKLGGKILFPGLFDPHVHFGVGGKTFGDDTMLADFEQNTRECLVGGVTTISTTTLIGNDPLTDLFGRALRCGTGHSWCDFKLTSCVNNFDQAAAIPSVVKSGGVSFKFFTGFIGAQAEAFGINKEGINPDLFYASCKALAASGPNAFPMIHAEEPYLRGFLVDEMRRQGRKDYLTAWAETTPEWAESVQVFTYGHIANQFRLPLYPVHISSAHTVKTIRYLRQQGIPIVAETLALFLCTTALEADAKNLGTKAKIQPPIRFEADRESLWSAIRDGTIMVVGTDSLTYSASFKEEVEFWDCRVGLNLQVADTLPLLFDEGINRGRVDLVTLARVLSENVARLYGIYPQKGAIMRGADADLVVIDPDREATLGRHRYRGQTDYSIWEGRRVKGVPVMTLLRGNLVMQDGEIVGDTMLGKHVAAA